MQEITEFVPANLLALALARLEIYSLHMKLKGNNHNMFFIPIPNPNPYIFADGFGCNGVPARNSAAVCILNKGRVGIWRKLIGR